ncbi:MAG: YncE family protein [Candidatus Binatia bacterium]
MILGSSGNPAGVGVIDTSRNALVATPDVIAGPTDVEIVPDGAFAYVTGLFGVVVVDTATKGTVAGFAKFEGNPTAVAFTPDGASAYVAFPTEQTVVVIDTAMTQIVATLKLSGCATKLGRYEYMLSECSACDPTRVVVNPEGSKLNVTSNVKRSVSVIDTIRARTGLMPPSTSARTRSKNRLTTTCPAHWTLRSRRMAMSST